MLVCFSTSGGIPCIAFNLNTDASDVGLGAVLSQEVKGTERVVAYFSRVLSGPDHHSLVWLFSFKEPEGQLAQSKSCTP